MSVGDIRPTGTVTFLFSDIEGSTRLWEAHPETMKDALAEHDNIVRSAIESATGYVFSTSGDAFSAAFERPSSAIEAAISAQQSLEKLAGVEPAIRVRMAVHTGAGDERDGDYFGPALNRTARLLSIGHGGQILVSLATEELLQDSLAEDVSLRDLGDHRLKDLSKPQHVFQLDHPGLDAEHPPLRSLDAFSHRLPVQLTSFVGREEELEEVAKLIRGARMVTLAGVGGAGKTRLAVHTAAELLPEFPDGCWLVELAPLTDPSRIASTAATTLGIPEKPSEDPLDTVAAWMSDKDLLLMLDNCEHLIDEAARFAERILEAGRGVTVLATSREMLGVPGEYPYQVKSLSWPRSGDQPSRAALLRYPAVRLFAERAELARRGFRITADNAEAVVEICDRLDGIPLAIELAAARLRMMKTAQIAERLDDRFKLLTGGSRTVLPRQQTLQAAIDWSYELLPDNERALFARLAVFMGGFTLDAAEIVCSDPPLSQEAILDLLSNLVDKSLVQVEDHNSGLRYRMLETLRQYARARLSESEEVASTRQEHAIYFRSLAEEAEQNLRSAEEEHWFSRLDAELDNLRQAMGWALESGEGVLAQATAGALYRYFMYRFRSTEGQEWAEAAVAASEEPNAERAKVLLAAGTLAQTGRNLDISMKYLDLSIETARAIGNDAILGAALNNRAIISEGMGMIEEAERLWLENLELSQRREDPAGETIAMINLSSAAMDVEDYELAAERATRALAVASGFGSERLIDEVRSQLFLVFRDSGQLAEAALALDEMLAEEEKRGFRYRPGQTAFMGAMLATDNGNYDSAVELMITALRRFKTLPDYESIEAVIQYFLHHAAALLLGCNAANAATMLGASEAITEGYGRSPSDRRTYDKTWTAVESADPDFETAFAYGQTLTPLTALELLTDTLDGLIARD